MSDPAVPAAPTALSRASIPPSLGEEIVHAATHGVGAVLSLAVLVLLVGNAMAHGPDAPDGNVSNVVSAAVFGASLVLVYVSSTLYHATPRGWERAKGLLQILDHAAIHVLIAGTATPIILCAFDGDAGWIALAVMWSLALFGIVVEVSPLRRRKRLSMGVYLGNGWIGALTLPALYSALSFGSLSCLVLGGVAYTAGVPFFLHRKKWMHAWWHAFVLAGSGLHVAAVILAMS